MANRKRALLLFIAAVLCGIVGTFAALNRATMAAMILFGLAVLGLAGAVLALVDKADREEGLSAPNVDQGKTGFTDPDALPPDAKDSPTATGDPRRGGEAD